jgi:hypothetical protein
MYIQITAECENAVYVVECFEVTCSLPAGDVGTCTPYSENAV